MTPLWFQVIPTIIMIKDAQTRGYVVGFTDLGNTDEFSTEMLEWRIAHVRTTAEIKSLINAAEPDRFLGSSAFAAVVYLIFLHKI